MNKKKVEPKKAYFFLLLLFKVLLDLSYIYYLNPIFSYMGFTIDISFLKLIESYLLIFIIVYFLPQRKIPSNIALNVLNILVIIPILSIFAMKNEPRVYLYGVVISFSLLMFIIKKIPRIDVSNNLSLNNTLYFLFICLTGIVYGSLLFLNGLPSLALFNFNLVYEIRNTINYGSNLIEYFTTWQGAVVNVFLLIISALYRKRNLFIVIALMQILLYLLTSHKSFLFYPFLVYSIILILRSNINLNIAMAATANFGIITALLLHVTKISDMIPSLIINRTYFLPAQISFQYYEYFSQKGYVFLSHSIFSFAFANPVYEKNPIILIGETYYNNNWPNTGYLGDSYMNFGILGILFFSVILGFVLLLIDSLSNTPIKLLLSNSFIIVFMIPLSNMGLLTSMLYGGLLVYILILAVFNSTSIKKPYKKFHSKL